MEGFLPFLQLSLWFFPPCLWVQCQSQSKVKIDTWNSWLIIKLLNSTNLFSGESLGKVKQIVSVIFACTIIIYFNCNTLTLMSMLELTKWRLKEWHSQKSQRDFYFFTITDSRRLGEKKLNSLNQRRHQTKNRCNMKMKSYTVARTLSLFLWKSNLNK